MATLIKANGEVTEVVPQGKKKFSLADVQGFVGGYVERVNLGHGNWALVNEEGLVHGLPYNRKASERIGIQVVGDVLFLQGKEW